MKRIILASIAVGLLVVSCGGGNINKVKNGMFPNYDKSITVGKALENNELFKGGKWKSIEKNGREYVTYTVKYSSSQIPQLLEKYEFTKSGVYSNFTNMEFTRKMYSYLNSWVDYSDEKLAQNTSLSKEEVKQLFPIFKDISIRNVNVDEPMYTIDGVEIIISFLMNQDGSFETNMIEYYIDAIMNCLGNKKFSYSGYNTSYSSIILDMIYNNKTKPFLY